MWPSNGDNKLMALTFTTLKTAIQDYLETTEATLVSNLPLIIQQAENAYSSPSSYFRKAAGGVTTSGNQYLETLRTFYLRILWRLRLRLVTTI